LRRYRSGRPRFAKRFRQETRGKSRSRRTQENAKENPADNTVKVGEPKKEIDNESKQLPGEKELKPEEKNAAENLKKQDQKVRTHEQAHLSAGGGLVKGGASYSFTTGPDGKQYATGGEVKIDMSPVPDDPQATISKMQQVKRAALAPSDPSPQDRNVASLATAKEAEARAELNAQKTENMSKSPSKSKQHFAVDAYLKQENQSSVKNKTADNSMLSLKSNQ